MKNSIKLTPNISTAAFSGTTGSGTPKNFRLVKRGNEYLLQGLFEKIGFMPDEFNPFGGSSYQLLEWQDLETVIE